MNISSLSNTTQYLTDKVNANKLGNSGGVESKPEDKSFGKIFSESLEQVNTSQKQADQLTETFLAGGPVEIHQMLLAMEKADLALRQTVEIRNKLVDAYKQIANMQI